MPPETPLPVIRILAREIREGDRRKSEAHANLAPTGGGARDLRLSPSERFATILERMFPDARQETTNRTNPDTHQRERTQVTVRSGTLYWYGNPTGGERLEQSRSVEIWPPYPARDEFRLATVHEFSFWTNLPDDPAAGRILMLLIQDSDRKVWIYFATERSLDKGQWHPKVADFLRSCLDQKSPQGADKAAVGFIDFETDERFPNG